MMTDNMNRKRRQKEKGKRNKREKEKEPKIYPQGAPTAVNPNRYP